MIRRALSVSTLALALALSLLAPAPASAAEGGDPSISALDSGAASFTHNAELLMVATKFTEVTGDAIAGDTIVPIAILGAIANGKYLEIEAPYDFEVEEVSVRAAAVTNPADGDVTADVLDDGASILTAPLSLGAANTTAKQTDMSRVILKGSVVRVAFALTGTGPALQDAAVAISGRRHLT